jgi:hypothetical protein
VLYLAVAVERSVLLAFVVASALQPAKMKPVSVVKTFNSDFWLKAWT